MCSTSYFQANWHPASTPSESAKHEHTVGLTDFQWLWTDRDLIFWPLRSLDFAPICTLFFPGV